MEETATPKKDPHLRHQRVWSILRPLAKLICFLRLGFRAVPARVAGPYLLVCNHVTDWDPVLMGCSFPEQAYYVASEHLLRSRLGKLVAWLQEPIPRQKGGSAAGTVLSMLRHLKKGHNVAVFPEGNRTWDGVTAEFPPSIGKLVKKSGVKLVTYRLEGGYFTSPRWAWNTIRRGKMRGHVVKIYTPEELKTMTPDQVDQAIRDDLHEDAYARQRKDPVVYRGRRSAEHMETLLFLCPRCGRVHSLQSKGDTVRCWKCGFSFRYLPTGFLEGEDIPFDNLRDWAAWQNGEIARLCAEAEDDRPIFTDTDMRADRVDFAKGLQPMGKGELKLFRDRLELPGASIPLAELSGIALVEAQDLYLGAGSENYLVRSSLPRCLVKYLTACRCLTGRDYGV